MYIQPDTKLKGEFLNSSRSSKNSSSRKRQKLQLWIWCILTNSLPYVYANYPSGIPTIYPEGLISIMYGNPLEIFCVADSNYTSNDIEFMSAGNYIESDIVNETTRRLYISKPKKQNSVFYCKNYKTRKNQVSRILVDSLPEPVTDFNCISKNLDVLSCSWTNPDMFSVVTDSLSFLVNEFKSPACEISKGNKNRNCVWTTTSQPRYRQNVDILTFELKSCNVLGCNYQNFTIDHHSIVKPDPLIDLKVTNTSTNSASLNWNVPYNMVEFCDIEHIIQYSMHTDQIMEFHTVNISPVALKYGRYTLMLTNLPYANTNYEVRVYIKTTKAVQKKFWSNYSSTVFRTASEKPRKAPNMVAGSFDQGTYNNMRYLRVYWKQIDKFDEAGDNFTYNVIVSQGRIIHTLFPDKKKSLGFVLFNATADALDVTVRSLNNVGSSDNRAHIYIPSEEDILSLRSSTQFSFTKKGYDNGTYELFWTMNEDIDNSTLFWCQHHLKKSKICVERIDFVVLDPQRSTYVIDLPREYNYEFAISVNKGTKSSGMIWAKTVEDDFVIDLL